MSKTTAGYLSMFGTLIAVLIVGAAYGDPGGLWNDILSFLTGRGDEIARVHKEAPIAFVSGGLFLAALSVIAGFASLFAIRAFIGDAKPRPELFPTSEGKDLKIFRGLFLVVLLEELFARGLFLGLLRQVPILSGPVGLYVLFFLGNGIWSLLHLGNYVFKEDKHPMRVLPQFLGGVLDTVAFLKWGLFGSILVHFTHNAIVFAVSKRESIGPGWAIQVAATGLLFLIAMIGFDKPLSDIGAWLAGGNLQPLSGWTSGDYVWLSVLVSSALSLASLLLLYDQTRLSNGSALQRLGFIKTISILFVALTLGAVFAPLLSYAAYWFVGLFIDDMTGRIAGACLLMALFGKTDSMSRAVRSYWGLLTSSFIFLCTVATLGIGPAIQMSFFAGLIQLPFIYLQFACPVGDEAAPVRAPFRVSFGRSHARRFR